MIGRSPVKSCKDENDSRKGMREKKNNSKVKSATDEVSLRHNYYHRECLEHGTVLPDVVRMLSHKNVCVFFVRTQLYRMAE